MFVFGEEWQLLLSESRLILNANVDHSISQHIPTGLGHAFVVYLSCLSVYQFGFLSVISSAVCRDLWVCTELKNGWVTQAKQVEDERSGC